MGGRGCATTGSVGARCGRQVRCFTGSGVRMALECRVVSGLSSALGGVARTWARCNASKTPTRLASCASCPGCPGVTRLCACAVPGACATAYVNRVEPGDLVDISGNVWLASRSGILVGAFPLDYIHWTAATEASTGRASDRAQELGLEHKSLFLRGRFSPAARAALEKRGWKTTEKVSFVSK